jgi:glycosyltransferase involved in cell wall biosynthesis
MPTVSVVVRTKDRPLLLRRALLSISSQTFSDFEVVLVNDGGDEMNLSDLLQGVTLRHQLVNNPRSIGRAEALNVGVSRSAGVFIAVHDDDDSWDPNFLLKMVQSYDAMTGRFPFHVVGMVSRLVRVEERIVESEIISTRQYAPTEENASKGLVNLFKYLAIEEDFYPIQTLFRRDDAMECGLFNGRYSMLEDREFFFRLLNRGEMLKVEDAVAYHHVRGVDARNGSYSNTVRDEYSTAIYHTLLDNLALKGALQVTMPGTPGFLQFSPFAKEVRWARHYSSRVYDELKERKASRRFKRWRRKLVEALRPKIKS